MRYQFSQVFSRNTVGLLVLAVSLVGAAGCGGSVDKATNENSAAGGGGQVGGAPGSGGRLATGTGGSAQSGGVAATGGQSTRVTGGSGQTGGTNSTGGQSTRPTGGSGQTGGATATGGQSVSTTGGSGQTGGTNSTGGQSTRPTGGSGQTGGATGIGGQTGTAGSSGSCVPTKSWGTADPAKAGPFEVVTESNVGPAAGVPDALYNNASPHFNLYRPKDLSQGYCHPIVTWGNGTGDQPKTYEVLIKQLASHGFIVVASLSSQTAQGTPLPQIAGVDWMIQENENPSSALYHHLDIAHIGATGHSQGGAATTMSGADPRITAIAPICGSKANITLHGPAALLCGGSDTMVPCSNVQPAYDTISTVPVMLLNSLADTHGSWIGSIQNPFMVAVTGWMRVHLMGDAANRGMFYGATCKMCSDTRVKITRKSMDQ